MQKDELTVEVVDRRLQVDLDAEEGVVSEAKNEFMHSQGFESKEAANQEYEEE
jgi:hypothetical protein